MALGPEQREEKCRHAGTFGSEVPVILPSRLAATMRFRRAADGRFARRDSFLVISLRDNSRFAAVQDCFKASAILRAPSDSISGGGVGCQSRKGLEDVERAAKMRLQCLAMPAEGVFTA